MTFRSAFLIAMTGSITFVQAGSKVLVQAKCAASSPPRGTASMSTKRAMADAPGRS